MLTSCLLRNVFVIVPTGFCLQWYGQKFENETNSLASEILSAYGLIDIVEWDSLFAIIISIMQYIELIINYYSMILQ